MFVFNFKHCNLSKERLALFSIYYLYVPLAIFLCSWIKWWIGVPIAFLLGLCPLWIFRSFKGQNAIKGKPGIEFTIIIVLAIWCLLSGIGGYFWQNRWDHLFRNALFLDLFNRSWPVSDGGDILTYYIGFWLPAALIAKVTGSLGVGWLVQYLYGLVGLLLAFRLMVEIIGNIRLRYLLPFILFSGIDIVYYIIYPYYFREDFHIELWSIIASWQSNTTLIFWVYNQAIPSWVATMLMLNFGRKKGVAPIILCFLSISAPFSVVGLFPLALYYQLEPIGRLGFNKQYLKFLFNPYSFIALIGIVPVFIYFSFNTSTHISYGFGNLMAEDFIKQIYILFLLEILVFVPFIYSQIKKKIEFYILLVTCFVCLFIHLGNTFSEFNWRVELPLNFFMTLQIAIFLNLWKSFSIGKRVLFVIIAALALITPSFELSRTFYHSIKDPVSEYRSIEHTSIFDVKSMRENFIADSILCTDKYDNKLIIFNYNPPPCH